MYDYRTVGIPDSCYLLKQKRSFMMIKLVLKLLVFFCCLAELHASRQRLIANVFLVGCFFWFFYCIAQRFCKTERPLFSFTPADRMIALIFLCQFVLSRPSCLTQQQYYLSVHLSYFRNCLVCMFWFEETACLLSFKWPLNTPKEDLILFVFHPLSLCQRACFSSL